MDEHKVFFVISPIVHSHGGFVNPLTRLPVMNRVTNTIIGITRVTATTIYIMPFTQSPTTNEWFHDDDGNNVLFVDWPIGYI